MESGRVEEERLTLWRRNGSRRGGGTAHPVEEERLAPWRRNGSPRGGGQAHLGVAVGRRVRRGFFPRRTCAPACTP